MRKKIKLEVEVTLDENVEQRAIQIARKRYSEVGRARAPLDGEGDRWRDVPAEEFIPDAEAAITELIGANDLLDEAGVEVTSVSGPEPELEELRPREPYKGGLQDGVHLTGQVGGSDADLDEFETGVYLFRWPNGDFSLVTAVGSGNSEPFFPDILNRSVPSGKGSSNFR